MSSDKSLAREFLGCRQREIPGRQESKTRDSWHQNRKTAFRRIAQVKNDTSRLLDVL